MALSKYEQYEIVEMKREDLTEAPFNPRKISDKARTYLLRNVKKHGLLSPIVWNVQTGHVISGHQRLNVLDSLHRTKKYSLSVAKVNLSPAEEKEQIVFFNNQEAQGEWDLPKLENLLKDPQINLESTGFDLGQVYQLFGDSPFVEQPDALIKLSEQLKGIKKRHADIGRRNATKDDVDFYLVVVFRSNEERKRLTDQLGLPDNRFVDGRLLVDAVK